MGNCCGQHELGEDEDDDDGYSLKVNNLRSTCLRRLSININQLPDCILLFVFQYFTFSELCKCSRVCRRWNNLSKDDSLRWVVEVRDVRLSAGHFKKMVRAHMTSAVKVLQLRGIPKSLWLAPITPRVLAKLQKRCPNLICLIMEDFNFRSPKNEKCVSLRDFPSSLKSLSLRGSVVARQAFLQHSGNTLSLPSLEKLDLSHCIFLADGTITNWPDMPSLQELYLEGCPFIDSILLGMITKKLNQLKVLDIEATYVTDVAALIVSRNTVNIEELYLGSTSVKDSTLLMFTNAMFRNLKKICLAQTHVSDTGLINLATVVPSLKWIKVDMTRVTERGIHHVKNLLPFCTVVWDSGSSIFTVFRHEGCGHREQKQHFKR